MYVIIYFGTSTGFANILHTFFKHVCANLRKATISFSTSDRTLSDGMEQLGYYWPDFLEILYW